MLSRRNLMKSLNIGGADKGFTKWKVLNIFYTFNDVDKQ